MLLSKMLSPKTPPIRAKPVTIAMAARITADIITANNLALLAFIVVSLLLTKHLF